MHYPRPPSPFLIAAIFCLFMAGLASAQYLHEFKITAGDGVMDDRLGTALAVEGDLAVIGAAEYRIGENCAGKVYLFQQNAPGDQWNEVKKLTARDGEPGDKFGAAVAISGDHIIVGAYDNDDLGSASGSAYIFARHEGGPDSWGEVQRILAPDGAASDFFGTTVSISGDTAIVGAFGNDEHGDRAGAAYLFQRNQGGTDNWGLVKKIHSNAIAAYDSFGHAVAIHGDLAAVSASGDDHGGIAKGAVYVFGRHVGGPDSWGQIQVVFPNDAANVRDFGEALAFDGDLLLVSDYRNDGPEVVSGAAYLFSRNQGGPDSWGEIKKLVAPDGASSDYFGNALALCGDLALVGAYNDGELGERSGSAYLFQRDEGGADQWGFVRKFTGRDSVESDEFGRSVGLNSEAVLAGAWQWDDLSEAVGAVYSFNQPQGAHHFVFPDTLTCYGSVGRASDPISVSITSSGTDPLTVTDLSFSDTVFSPTGIPGLPAVLLPGEALDFQVRYDPQKIGTDDAVLTIDSSDDNDPQVVIDLHGKTLNPALPGVGYGSTAVSIEDALIVTLDVASGTGRYFREIPGIVRLSGLAIDSASGIHAAEEYLYRVDGITAEYFEVCYLNGYFQAIAFDENDVLYAASMESLYTINAATGEKTLIGVMGEMMDGLAFDPTDGTLYASKITTGYNPDELFMVDKNTGATTSVGTTGIPGSLPDIAFDRDGNLYGVKPRAGTGPESVMISIDKTTGAGTLIGPTGIYDIRGLDIAGPAPLMVDPYLLPASAGGTFDFILDAGSSYGGREYLILGCVMGTVPGTALPGGARTLPLNWDGLTDFILVYLNTPLFADFYGTLNGLGMGSAQIVTPPVPSLAGIRMYYAYCLGNPFDYVSNPVMLEFVP